MKEGNNNLMNGIERLSKLVTYIQTLKGQVSIIERDLLLQELRNLYMEVLTWDMSADLSASTSCKEPQEVVAFENIMNDVHPIEESIPTPSVEMKSEEVVKKQEPMEVEKHEVKEVVVEKKIMDDLAQAKIEEAVAEFKEEPKVEAPMKEEEEESPFAPAEPEVEEETAPEPIMEAIEGNQYEELFEEKPIELTQPIVEKKAPIEEAPKAKEESPQPRVEQKEAKPIVSEEEVKREADVQPEEIKVEKTVASKTEHKQTMKTTQPSLFDYLSTSATVKEQPTAPTLADKLGIEHATLESQLEQKVHSQKVSDLRTVININDKFSFMMELFHSNMKAYNDFILKLNAISKRDEAMDYVDKISKQYAWDSNSIAVKTFYKVMERKF